MRKFWNGKIKKIKVYEKETKRRIVAFLADDKTTEQGLVLFCQLPTPLKGVGFRLWQNGGYFL